MLERFGLGSRSEAVPAVLDHEWSPPIGDIAWTRGGEGRSADCRARRDENGGRSARGRPSLGEYT